jgi:hypothetical protein
MPLMDDVNLDDLEPTVLIDDGEEVDFLVMSAERINKEDGMGNITSRRIALAIVPQVDAPGYIPPVYHALFLSKPGDEKWKVQGSLRKLDYFCKSIGYEPVGGKVDPEEFKGKSGRAVFGQEDDKQSGERKNVVRKFIS